MGVDRGVPVLELAGRARRRVSEVVQAARGRPAAPTAPGPRTKVPLAAPSGQAVFENYLQCPPSIQSTLDLFEGEWASRLPPPYEGLRAGSIPLFEDERIAWLIDRLGGLHGMRVLELGPLEAGHTFMLEQGGADSVLGIEANVRAYLRCLIIKELLSLRRARFLCGDFVEWLRTAQDRFDLCVASGVLYHMRQPVELLELISEKADCIFLWTHYYDADRIPSGSPMAANFADTVEAAHDGFAHVLHRQVYGPELQTGFCGGNERFSMWMEREGVLGALEHFGFRDVEIGFDVPDHPNGPSLALLARRRR